MTKNLIKCFVLVPHTSPMPCYAMPCKVCIIPSWHTCLLVAYYLYDCAMYLFRPLVCLVFIRIDTEQGEYQEPQEYYLDPSYSATELPDKQFPMLAYIQYQCLYLILASYVAIRIKLNPMYCTTFTFKPHYSLSPPSYEPLLQELFEPCKSQNCMCRVCASPWIMRYLNNLI